MQSYVFMQRVIDKRLIIAATRFVHKSLEVFNNVRIEANRNTFLIGTGFDHRAPFAFAEIFTHKLEPR